MTAKTTVLIDCAWLEEYSELTDAEYGAMIRNLQNYQLTEIVPTYESRDLRMAFKGMKMYVDEQNAKYDARCEANRANGKKGGRPPKASATSKTDEKQLVNEKPKKAHNDNDSDNDSDNDIYKYIIDYLNEKAGTRYKVTTPKTRALIRARLNEGFSKSDFKTVIDKKVAEWRYDASMSKYIRPETLFGTKFEAYLNQKAPQGAQNRPKNRFNDFEQRDNSDIIEKLEKSMIGG